MLISPEYKMVLKKSSNRVALESAHSTRLTKAQVYPLIFAYLDDHECQNVTFGTGRPHAYYDGEGIKLNKDQLTVGIVLHEVAHVISYQDKKIKGHGPNFVKVLDSLIKSELEYEGCC